MSSEHPDAPPAEAFARHVRLAPGPVDLEQRRRLETEDPLS